MAAHWIKNRRRELGINQSDLAARLQVSGIDVSQGTISHWEVGRYNPPLHDPDFRIALADALMISTEELLVMAGYMSMEEHKSMALRAAEIVERLPPTAQELALDYLNMLEKKYLKRASSV